MVGQVVVFSKCPETCQLVVNTELARRSKCAGRSNTINATFLAGYTTSTSILDLVGPGFRNLLLGQAVVVVDKRSFGGRTLGDVDEFDILDGSDLWPVGVSPFTLD